MGQKYRVHRDVIIETVLRDCGVDLNQVGNPQDLVKAIVSLDNIKALGLSLQTISDDTKPSCHGMG